MRLGVEEPLPLRSSALLPRNPTTTTYYRLAYFYSATLAWFYSALDTWARWVSLSLSPGLKTAVRIALRIRSTTWVFSVARGSSESCGVAGIS